MTKTVSIIIPCRNEEKHIERCVQSVLQNDYPSNLTTIYVCDGLSDDATRGIIEKMAKSNSNILLLDNKKQTTQHALNLGLQTSTADVKIILGAHTEVYPDFISENIKLLFSKEEIGCSGGILENIYENDSAKVISKAMSSSFGVGNAHFRTGTKNGYVDTVAFGAFKNEIFEKIGYFDTDLTRNQDDEFSYRLIKNGYKIALSNKIKTKYFVRSSYTKLYKQYYQYGFWKVFVNVKHKTVTTLRQLIPLFFVLFLIVGGALSFLHIYLAICFAVILALYLTLNVVSALKASDNVKDALLISYTFLILHLSYGLGYLNGIINFILLKRMPNSNNTVLTR